MEICECKQGNLREKANYEGQRRDEVRGCYWFEMLGDSSSEGIQPGRMKLLEVRRKFLCHHPSVNMLVGYKWEGVGAHMRGLSGRDELEQALKKEMLQTRGKKTRRIF